MLVVARELIGLVRTDVARVAEVMLVYAFGAQALPPTHCARPAAPASYLPLQPSCTGRRQSMQVCLTGKTGIPQVLHMCACNISVVRQPLANSRTGPASPSSVGPGGSVTHLAKGHSATVMASDCNLQYY